MNKTYVQPVLHKATTEWLRLNVAPHLKDQFAIEKLAKEIKALAPEFDEKHFISYAKEMRRRLNRLDYMHEYEMEYKEHITPDEYRFHTSDINYRRS